MNSPKGSRIAKYEFVKHAYIVIHVSIYLNNILNIDITIKVPVFNFYNLQAFK